MSLAIHLLGTSASRPTIERNVSSIAITREGETLLIDCGEGTQRQMMRYGVSFNVADIFFTHFHADHVIGAIGLLRTMALQGRTETLRMWGARGGGKYLRKLETFGGERLSFPVEVHEMEPDAPIARAGYELVPFRNEHGGPLSLGYALIEEARKGRFDPEVARSLGIPEGPLWGRIHRGETVTLDDGRVIDPAAIVGAPRHGRRVVISGDTRPCPATVAIAQDADLLVHEATFGEEEQERAVATGHATAREAATVAKEANVLRLVLTHFSARYSRDAVELEREARAVFPRTIAGRDGMEIDVPFRTDD
jgi:ribonuclease Z